MSIDPTRPILVYLANGVQGAAVVRAVLRRGLKVRALVRNRTRSQALNLPGVELAEGDLLDVDSLRAANAGVAHAVLQFPIGSDDVARAQVENALSATIACGLTSIVLKLPSASRPAPCEEPSFVSNAMIEAMVRHSGVRCAVVRPTMYLDNLLKPSVRIEIVKEGVFAPPIREAQRIAWTCADDCAEAAVRLLAAGAWGGDHRIAGPESVSGHELTARISAGLGRSVQYREQRLDEFEVEVERTMGVDVGSRIASKFRFFAAHRHEADTILSMPFEAQPGLDNFRPTPIEIWASHYRFAFLEEQPECLTSDPRG